MTLIGIVIFTVWTSYQTVSGSCDKRFSPFDLCFDVDTIETHEVGTPEAVYIGEFDSVDACQKAALKATWPVKESERLDQTSKVLCVPKKPKKAEAHP